MSPSDPDRMSRILKFAFQTVEHVQRVALPPGDWDEVDRSVHAMLTALERGDLDEVNRERQLLEKRLSVRQVAEARLDGTVVEPPPPLRSAAERLSRKLDTARSTNGSGGTRE